MGMFPFVVGAGACGVAGGRGRRDRQDRRGLRGRHAAPARGVRAARLRGCCPKSSPARGRSSARARRRPRRCAACLRAKARRQAATAVAHAPVPHAIVSPQPRSNTRMAMPSGPTAANSTFVFSGKASCVSKYAPMRSTSNWLTSSFSRKQTAWGFPIDTQVKVKVPQGDESWSAPVYGSPSGEVASGAALTGTQAGLSTGFPMSTVA